jgi:hypothetical protein
MRSIPATVSCEVAADVVAPSDAPLWTPVGLRYDRGDPYAVRLDFGAAADEGVTWVFARELLAQGLTARAGEGDVVVAPAPRAGRIRVTMSSPDGRAAVDLPADLLTDFLRATFDLCPAGEESALLDLDSDLRQVFPR